MRGLQHTVHCSVLKSGYPVWQEHPAGYRAIFFNYINLFWLDTGYLAGYPWLMCSLKFHIHGEVACATAAAHANNKHSVCIHSNNTWCSSIRQLYTQHLQTQHLYNNSICSNILYAATALTAKRTHSNSNQNNKNINNAFRRSFFTVFVEFFTLMPSALFI